MTGRRPSPAMIVALIALFVSLGGTSIAAVNYARNAGAVDGKSAVSARASLSRAAGKLVATTARGRHRGQFDARFLAGVSHVSLFGRSFDVTDNAPGAPQTMAVIRGLGSVTATCNDQDTRVGVENPITDLAFVNSSGHTVNLVRRVGSGSAAVQPLGNQTVGPLRIAGSNTFFYDVTVRGREVDVNGVVRQDGAGSGGASCLVYGTVSDASS